MVTCLAIHKIPFMYQGDYSGFPSHHGDLHLSEKWPNILILVRNVECQMA